MSSGGEHPVRLRGQEPCLRQVGLGYRVGDLRHGLGLSQGEPAEREDLHRNYIGGIERGQRNLGIVNVGKLGRALEVSVAELFEPFSH